MQSAQQCCQLLDQFGRGTDFGMRDCQPGLVSTQFMLTWSRQIAEITIRQTENESLLERALFLNLETDFNKSFKWQSCQTQITNSQCLDVSLRCFGPGLCFECTAACPEEKALNLVLRGVKP